MSSRLVFLAEHRVMSALTKVQVARQHILNTKGMMSALTKVQVERQHILNTKGMRVVTTRTYTPTKIMVLIIANTSCLFVFDFKAVLLDFDLTDFSI